MFKECFVPTCTNNNITCPSKIFISVPRDESRRKSWFDRANVEKLTKTRNIYCCEDHFDLKEDSENWLYYEAIGSKLILKKDAVPHRNLEPKFGRTRSPDQSSQLSSSARKRKSEILTSLSSVKNSKKQLFDVHDDIPSTSKQQQTQLTTTKEKHTTVAHSPSRYFNVASQRFRSVAVQVDIPVKEAKHVQKSTVALQVSMPKHLRSVGVNTRSQTNKAVKLPKTKFKVPVEVMSPVKSEPSVSSSDNTKTYESTSSFKEHFMVPSFGRRKSTEYL